VGKGLPTNKHTPWLIIRWALTGSAKNQQSVKSNHSKFEDILLLLLFLILLGKTSGGSKLTEKMHKLFGGAPHTLAGRNQ